MKRNLINVFSVALALIGSGCASSTVAVMEDIASLEAYSDTQIRFSLKEEFWVYFYPKKAVATHALSGIALPYRMTAASTGALGGWLGGMEREFWGILPVGTKIKLVGITRQGKDMCYVVKVEETEEKLFDGAFIEIYSGYRNYSFSHGPDGRPRLNEAFFQALND